MGKFRRFPQSKNPLSTGYALTVQVTKDPREVCAELLKGPYVDYVVWCVEYGKTKYHHMHINIHHKISVSRSNKYWDEVLGAHPYIQRVGNGTLDKRRLWRYYMKEGDWDCLTRNPEKTKAFRKRIKKEVSLGTEISKELGYDSTTFEADVTKKERQKMMQQTVTETVTKMLESGAFRINQ